MAPSSSPEHPLDGRARSLLLDLADETLVTGLEGRRPTVPPLAALPPALHRPVGAFVTLTVDGALNGCIGSIEGAEPLGHAVPRLAWSSAFADPRLPALRAVDYERLTIEISVLSPLAPVPADTRAVLHRQVRPGVDGLLLGAGGRQAVFLPSVWEELPDPDDFVDHLLAKAGLPIGRWSVDTWACVFQADRFGRPAGRASLAS